MAIEDTSRAKQLKTLAGSLPGANQQIQQGLQEARKTQLQETIRKMRPAQATTANIQQLGAQQAGQAGQIALQGQQQQQQQATQLGQMALQEQGRQQRQAGFTQQVELNQQQRNIADKLYKLGKNLKNDLLDKQLTFQRDKAGNALFSQRQLLDYAAEKAQSKEEFQNYAQDLNQLYQRKMQIFEQAHNKVVEALNRGYIREGKELNQAQKLELAKAAKALQDKLNRARIDAANAQAQTNALSGLLGAAIGGVAAGAVSGGLGAAEGAAVGASAGQTLGNILGL